MDNTTTDAADFFDTLETEASNELHQEYAAAARKRIKASLKTIGDAQRIVANLQLDHAALMADVRAGRLEVIDTMTGKSGRWGSKRADREPTDY